MEHKLVADDYFPVYGDDGRSLLFFGALFIENRKWNSTVAQHFLYDHRGRGLCRPRNVLVLRGCVERNRYRKHLFLSPPVSSLRACHKRLGWLVMAFRWDRRRCLYGFRCNASATMASHSRYLHFIFGRRLFLERNVYLLRSILRFGCYLFISQAIRSKFPNFRVSGSLFDKCNRFVWHSCLHDAPDGKDNFSATQHFGSDRNDRECVCGCKGIPLYRRGAGKFYIGIESFPF